jgi:hypothetical protein
VRQNGNKLHKKFLSKKETQAADLGVEQMTSKGIFNEMEWGRLDSCGSEQSRASRLQQSGGNTMTSDHCISKSSFLMTLSFAI